MESPSAFPGKMFDVRVDAGLGDLEPVGTAYIKCCKEKGVFHGNLRDSITNRPGDDCRARGLQVAAWPMPAPPTE
jgi:hypothetical protein